MPEMETKSNESQLKLHQPEVAIPAVPAADAGYATTF